MFGALKPKTCQLNPADRHAWRKIYCGSCQTLGESFSFLTRLTLSYDQVFFAVLIEALQASPSESSSCRCPAAPWVYRPTLAPESSSMQLSAALHVLLVDQWLYDQSLDRTWVWNIARSLIQNQTVKATHILKEYSSVVDALHSFTDRQTQLEHSTQEISLQQASTPTGELLSLLLVNLVAPLSPDYPNPQLIKKLSAFGMSLGIVIYLIDALEDLDKDEKANQFNVCLSYTQGKGGPDHQRITEALTVLKDHQQRLMATLGQLPLKRYHSILNHLIIERLSFKINTLKAIDELNKHKSVVKLGYRQRFIDMWTNALTIIHRLKHKFTRYVYIMKTRLLSILGLKKAQPNYIIYNDSMPSKASEICPSSQFKLPQINMNRTNQISTHALSTIHQDDHEEDEDPHSSFCCDCCTNITCCDLSECCCLSCGDC